MSGEVLTPTVFLSNRIIAQRHFNAMVFAQFLRTKVIEERVLGNIGQSIRLEGFIPADSRETSLQNYARLFRLVFFLISRRGSEHKGKLNVFGLQANVHCSKPSADLRSGKRSLSIPTTRFSPQFPLSFKR